MFKGKKEEETQIMRKNLAKMVQHVNMLNLHCTEDSPEYKLLENIITDEQIDVVLALKVRVPYTLEEVAKRAGISVEKATELCDQLCMIGVMEYEDEMVKVPIFAPGSMELMMLNKQQIAEHPEVAESFITYVENLTRNFTSMFPKGNGLVIAIPVEKEIAAEPKSVGIEHLSYWVEKYAPSLSVADCQCRRAGEMTGNIGADLPGEYCIQLGKFAESCIRTGRSRRITKEEAYQILEWTESLGYMHEVTNVDGKENSMFICNCHPEACLAFRTSRLVDTPNMMKNNYLAMVDTTKCVACGECMEVCPMNAAKLGRKLCMKNPVEIPANPTPDDHIWTKARRPGDFRNEKKDVIPEVGTSPCKTACPAHIAVQGYLKLAAMGRYDEALELIKKENPLPAVCGRICNRRCEDACTMGTISDPVAIDNVKKFIADRELIEEQRFVPKIKWNRGNKLAVIGAGPAGISCAYYAAVLGHDVTVFDKQEKAGGMLRYGIPSFRLEKDIIEAEVDVLNKLGVKFRFGCEVGKDVTIEELRAQGYKAFYVAVGLQSGGKLNVPGADAEGVTSGIDFMRLINENEDALKAGNVPKDAKITGNAVVIGGGNIGADVARTAVRSGADKVMMYALEAYEDLPMGLEDKAECEAEGISVNGGWGPAEILSEDGKVTGIRFKKCLSVRDSEARFAPVYDDSEVIEVECSTILYCTGQKIDLKDLLKGTKVEFRPNGTIEANPFTYQTAEPDIFVGGDAYTGQKFAIDAIAAGKQGADSLHRYSHKGHSLIIGRDRRNFIEIDKDNKIVESYDCPPRQVMPVDVAKRLTFSDDRLEYTEEMVRKETSRCLECGTSVVDHTRCIGCGLCTTRCKFDAIHLQRQDTYDFGGTYEELVPKVALNVVKRTARIAATAVKEKVGK